MYNIYHGYGRNSRRVIRDDGRVFESTSAANISAYGYSGGSIRHAIESGKKVKGHFWYWADGKAENSRK